jgi:hypothetical protein
MDTMRISHQLFALACEESKDGAVALSGFKLLAVNSCVDCIFAKAAESVLLEVGSG